MLTVEDKIFIGFAGRAGVGKTTTAKWFVEQHEFVRLAFGAPVKATLATLTDLPLEWFLDEKLKETEIPGLSITPRVLMQLFATEFVRNMVHPQFWVWRMMNSISHHSNRDIVIDDVRFENEAAMIREHGGTIIHLDRDFESNIGIANHKSELGLEFKNGDIYFKITNSPELTSLALSQYIFRN